MTLGEIKAEALKIMFADTVTDYEGDDIDKLAEDEYCKGYLVNMPGAINRCFANLESRGAVPPLRHVLYAEDAMEVFGGRARYDLKSKISDFLSLERVVREGEDGGYQGCDEFAREGDVIVCAALAEGERYVIMYRPRLFRIKSYTPNDTEVPLPENIAALIPYFIKGDLFRDDEPDEAQEARSWYEVGLEEMINTPESVQGRVKSVYSLVDVEDL